MEKKPNLRKKQPRQEEEVYKEVKEETAPQVGSISQLNVTYKAVPAKKEYSQISINSKKDEERIDYARGLCKDFHETGYCVFGDECIFMHDRTTWMDGEDQLSAEWNEQKRRNLGLESLRNNKRPKEQESKLPEAKIKDAKVTDSSDSVCSGCGENLKGPILMASGCKHEFCQACGLKNSKSCVKCGHAINGKFSILKR